MLRLIFKTIFYVILGIGAYALIQRYLPVAARAYYQKTIVDAAPQAAIKKTPQQLCYASCADKKLPRWICEMQYSCNAIK